MRVTTQPAPELKHDPWEEDCTGAHDGETLRIDCGYGKTLVVKELITGIGNSYTVHLEWEGKRSQSATFQVGDEGEMYP